MKYFILNLSKILQQKILLQNYLYYLTYCNNIKYLDLKKKNNPQKQVLDLDKKSKPIQLRILLLTHH